MTRRAASALRLIPLLALAACAARGPVLDRAAEPVELRDTPFFAQEEYQCGPAALAMSLGAAGVAVTPAELVDKVYIPELQGSLQAEMIAATRGYGRVPYVIEPELASLLAELRAGHPVLVLENLGWDFYPLWHYAVVIGFRPETDQLVLRSGVTRRKLVDADDFLDDWRKAERWGLVTLTPGRLPAGRDAGRYLHAVAGLEARGAHAAAAAAYEAATDRWPARPEAWLGLGNARYALNQTAAAEQAYREAVARDADAVVARNNLAQLLAERGCVDEARAEIRRALDAAPPDLVDAVRATRDEIAAMDDAGGSACPR